MGNNYFQFKQFTIQQEKSSMKVCTDSCLFGAWITAILKKRKINPKHVLDIGSGTGLLSLMIAQQFAASIDAVEINKDSFEQTLENFAESKWQQQLQVFKVDIKNYEPEIKYDFIICNPPFFENDLKSNDTRKNLAKHQDGLTFLDLIQSIKNNLSVSGFFSVILPFHRVENFADLAKENGFFLLEKLSVKQSPQHTFFRGMLFFGLSKEEIITNEIIIRDENSNYSEAFAELLSDYYLHL